MRALVAAGVLAAAILGVGVGPAAAHHPIVSGDTVCGADGTQTITWTITNSESVDGTNRAMTIDQVAITQGAVDYYIGQTFAPTPLPGSSVDADSYFGGDQAADVTLTVRVDFDGRGPQDVERSATVELIGGCVATTTTTEPLIIIDVGTTTTTTMAATTTTTTAAPTTTTAGPAVVATSPPTVLGVTETRETLPKTGAPWGPLLMAGIVAVATGGAALLAGRRHA